MEGEKPRAQKRRTREETPGDSSSSSEPKAKSQTWNGPNPGNYLCPICFEVFKEAVVTKCGHSFCQECLVDTLEHTSSKCPKCYQVINSATEVSPNFALNALAEQVLNWQKSGLATLLSSAQARSSHEAAGASSTPSGSLLLPVHGLPQCVDYLSQANLSGKDLEDLSGWLGQHKRAVAEREACSKVILLTEFLNVLKKEKQEALAKAKQDLDMVHSDLESTLKHAHRLGVDPEVSSDSALRKESPLSARMQSMHQHYPNLVDCYFETRRSVASEPLGDSPRPNPGGLNQFSTSLSKFTKYSGIRVMANLNYTSDMYSNASIVSSIEFDKDAEFFAIAGVTKRIKVYDYNDVIRDMVDIHYPRAEMISHSKISCVSWNSFHKNQLLSSDYDGTVTLWDARTTQKTKSYVEHEKRCWSVDFNSVDTKLFASASDDARVKLWSTSVNHSIASLEAKANVCSVKFNPTSCFHVAFGSADHCVHYFDLRNLKSPLTVFHGHKKAVSYVRFLNATELLSASTDSQLKLWDVEKKTCIQSYQGHINEKNFVGLTSDEDYFAGGSENNSFFLFYKGLSKPLFSFKFDAARTLFGRNDQYLDESNEFVSALCWRKGTDNIIGANSQGCVKIYRLGNKPEAEEKTSFHLVKTLDDRGRVGSCGPGSVIKMSTMESGTTMACLDDIEAHAHKVLPRNALDYYRSGADQMQTLHDNQKAFQRFRIAPKMLVDVSRRDLSNSVLGRSVNFPIGIAPTAMQRMAHPEGECASARAAQEMGTIFILSTIATSSIEEVAQAAPRARKWFQLYIYKDREVTKDLVLRAEKAGYEALVLTVDAPFFGRRLADIRNKFQLPAHLNMANFVGLGDLATKAGTSGGGSGINNYVASLFDQTLSWKDVAWLKSFSKLPIILKGILRPDDALTGLKYGASAIIVSNHGARQLDGVLATIDVLSSIKAVVGNRCELYLDGGVRLGTDVLKALALGAKMVFLGRPVIWGLAYDGQKGVKKTLSLIRDELDSAMALSGCPSVSNVDRDLVILPKSLL
eukprot:maker-scaffold487_size158652-snap-gene-0.44 protein:Tk00169 transcript:maker-scaffold487_size158652-snap-gene-0.44-mRNA-1 annotation:"e3 ubiquitin-protein ligase rfwd2-like"